MRSAEEFVHSFLLTRVQPSNGVRDSELDFSLKSLRDPDLFHSLKQVSLGDEIGDPLRPESPASFWLLSLKEQECWEQIWTHNGPEPAP